MAGAQVIDADGYRFTTRPLSWWRRLMHDFLPYWQGSKPKFLLTVKRIGEPIQEHTINVFVKFANGDVTKDEIVIPPLQTEDTHSVAIGGTFLGFTGDTSVIVPTNLVAPRPTQYQTLYAFQVTPKTWIFLTVVVALLAAVLTTLAQWLIGL